ncbi:hypothetical protein [Coleofasciculus chthonoplastes]|uniref:hypothetical protein n=1 Tax=Coleofasciculus chthonoplastes TaxID=64178 RepID=UPI0032FA54D1
MTSIELVLLIIILFLSVVLVFYPKIVKIAERFIRRNNNQISWVINLFHEIYHFFLLLARFSPLRLIKEKLVKKYIVILFLIAILKVIFIYNEKLWQSIPGFIQGIINSFVILSIWELLQLAIRIIEKNLGNRK